MKGKSAKKLKRLSKVLGKGKTEDEQKVLYKRLKNVHKANKGEI